MVFVPQKRSDSSKGTTINDLGGPEEIEKKKILAALLRGKKNFGGHSPGKMGLRKPEHVRKKIMTPLPQLRPC